MIEMTSRFLLRCNMFMPTDIHRSVRRLDVLKFWKGVEFRCVLLYIGMVVLRPVLNDAEYQHFLLLCSAATICNCNAYKTLIPIATNMFNAYIKEYIRLYGTHTITSNVHNLAHVTEDMIKHNIGNLSEISIYKYENCLRLIGLKLKNCNKPLEQIAAH